MPIEYDPAKRSATLQGRGLDMARAGEVFDGATMVVPVWTPRDAAQRIIGMRRANVRERRLYAPRLRPG